jgi:hypothetical protein
MPAFKTPQSILEAYVNGFVGSISDPASTEKLLSELPMPLFGNAANSLYGSGDGKLSLPYKSILKFVPDFGSYERQGTGDCVAHAFRNASDVSRAFEIDVNKEREGFIASGATEAIYGVRGHTGEGMTCSRAARFLNQEGGILLRKKYDNYDLSKYNPRLASSWGRSGTPSELKELGKANQVKTVSIVRSVQEAKDAIANGYCLATCSMSGFSSSRDKNGIASRNGQWAHAMAWIGVDDTKQRLNETLFLIQNSWGLWNSGPKFYEQPDGSFWVREQDAATMIANGEAWALSNVNGFPPRKISWSIDEVF